MEKLDIEKFNPTMAELTKRVAISQKIEVKDLRDIKQIALVQESRKSLRGFEIKIERTGKRLRQDARDFASSVIDREKELKAITSPEIERLKEIVKKSDDIILRDRRLENLPHRKEKLEEIGDNIEIGDDYLLSLSGMEFLEYRNKRVADKNEKDKIDEENRAEMARAKIKAEQDAQAKKLDEEKEALRIKEQEAQDKIDKANEAIDKKNKEAQDKIDEQNRKLEADKLELQHQKELKEAEEKAKKDLEEKQEADRLKVIEDKKKEDEKLVKRKAYIEFLKENGCMDLDDENFHIKKLDTKIVLYKKVGEFEI